MDVLLKGPGDSEHLVEAVLLRAKLGVGGVRSLEGKGLVCFGMYAAMREFEVAYSVGIIGSLETAGTVLDTGGRLIPRIEPGNGSVYPDAAATTSISWWTCGMS